MTQSLSVMSGDKQSHDGYNNKDDIFVSLFTAMYLDDFFFKQRFPSSQDDLTRFLPEADAKPQSPKTRRSDLSLGLDKSFNLSDGPFPGLLSGDSDTHFRGLW